MKNASRSPYRSTLHRDGSASVWDAYYQVWSRIVRLSDDISASMDAGERGRVERHLARHRVPVESVPVVLIDEAAAQGLNDQP